MEPKITEKPDLTLVGVVASGTDAADVDIAGLWQYFAERSVPGAIEDVGYEVHICEEPKNHFCFVGMQVANIPDYLPADMFIKVLPSARYAVFTHDLKDGGFKQAFERVYEWLDSSEYVLAHPYDVQYYGQGFTGHDGPWSEVDIWLPIRKADAAGRP